MGASELTLCSAKAIANGVTDYTDSCNIRFAQGHMAALVVLAVASNVTITQQCSFDNTNWYDPVDIVGTALGTVYTALTASAYIYFSPILAVWMRFKIVAAADSVVTMTVISKE